MACFLHKYAAHSLLKFHLFIIISKQLWNICILYSVYRAEGEAMKKGIDYLTHVILIMVVGIFLIKIGDKSHVLMSGYLTSITLTFITCIALIYLLIKKILNDMKWSSMGERMKEECNNSIRDGAIPSLWYFWSLLLTKDMRYRGILQTYVRYDIIHLLWTDSR